MLKQKKNKDARLQYLNYRKLYKICSITIKLDYFSGCLVNHCCVWSNMNPFPNFFECMLRPSLRHTPPLLATSPIPVPLKPPAWSLDFCIHCTTSERTGTRCVCHHLNWVHFLLARCRHEHWSQNVSARCAASISPHSLFTFPAEVIFKLNFFVAFSFETPTGLKPRFIYANCTRT